MSVFVRGISTMFLGAVLAVLFSACKNESDQIYVESIPDTEEQIYDEGVLEPDVKENNEENDSGFKGELKIYTYGSVEAYEDWKDVIDGFTEKYPKVEIKLIGAEEQIGLLDYVQMASRDLLSGESVDIFDMQWMPYSKYLDSGLFEDIYVYMKNDPEFIEEDYYMNIFEGMEYKGQLVGITPSFWYNAVRFNKEILEEIGFDYSSVEVVDYKLIAELYFETVEFGNKYETIIPFDSFDQLLLIYNECHTFIDEENKEARFDSEEFRDFLYSTKNMNWNFTPKYRDSDPWRIEEDALCLLFSSINWLNSYYEIIGKESESVTKVYPYAGSDGNSIFHIAKGPLGIPSHSENKELAWEFLKFIIEEKDYTNTVVGVDYLPMGFPVNRKNTLQLLEKAYGETMPELIEQIDTWNINMSSDTRMSRNSELYNEITMLCSEYYEDLISEDECMQEIQKRAEIYLKE